MNESKSPKPSLGTFKPGARRAVSLARGQLVEMEPPAPGRPLPLVVRPAVQGLDLAEWAAGNRELLEEKLLVHGGILFRGFPVATVEAFEGLIAAVAGAPLEYRERSSPRSTVQGNVYTSTDYPPEYPIFLHNENSYQRVVPQKIFFFCLVAPEDRGETPIADCRGVYRRIDPEVRRRFEERDWMYVRNFGSGLGLDWPTVFQTEDRDEVERYCRENGIEAEWREEGRLRTRAVRAAVARHPATGEPVWFNHATFYHVSTLEPAIGRALTEELAEEDLPANTYYGDGSPIEPEVLDRLREAYRAETVSFPWRQGDVLMLDNILVAHGRQAFSGPRKIVVGMAQPRSRDEVVEEAIRA
ncbi:MAG TPA: TauD/TfdA family dioxygenase [Thermoanaerobaculia bacterium]|nr:TauD/TfdA family dioxygenase [Thermoanaerobaculia bacterium]